MTKTIRQTVTFDAPPHAVFEALLDSRRHAAFSGEAARVSRRVGGPVRAYGGYIEGKNLRIERDRLLVQSWRTTDFNGDEADSQVSFRLRREGKGTRLSFVHSRIPDRLADSFREGWPESYWEPLKAYLARATA